MRTRKRPPSHPGSILKLHYVEPSGISVTDLAKELRLSRKTVSKILNERGAVTTDVALRLSKAFDTTPELWLNLQRNYDLWHTANETTDWRAIRPLLKIARAKGAFRKASSDNDLAGPPQADRFFAPTLRLRGHTMQCPKCGFENPDAKNSATNADKTHRRLSNVPREQQPGSKFCGDCGHDLTQPSPAIPKELSFDEKIAKIQKYLPSGITEKILSQRDRIEGEKRQVTVMFCDMKGFTPLSEKLGPETMYAMMDEVYEILIHKVHEYEGTVNEMTGDGVMALFGAPIALEDAPQRAIRSAMAIHREMTRFNERMRQEKGEFPAVKMRIGIHTGPVVVGTLGNDLRVEFKAVGDTVNLAARMEQMAEPATTYVTEDTFNLTEGFFRFESLGEKEIKGKEKPLKVYQVIAPSSRRTRFDVSAERGLTPIVGRGRELALLLDGFERAKSGRGQAFSIVSEAGCGKSRLLYEFRKALANEDALFLEGKCLSYGMGVAYHPVIDILKSLFDLQEGESDQGIKERVKMGLGALGVDEPSTLPYLLELLSVKESGLEQMFMSREAKKDRISEAIKRVVLKGSEKRPLVLAIEDLHWMDGSSADVIRDVLEILTGARILLIMTYRPQFVPTWGVKSYHSHLTAASAFRPGERRDGDPYPGDQEDRTVS